MADREGKSIRFTHNSPRLGELYHKKGKNGGKKNDNQLCQLLPTRLYKTKHEMFYYRRNVKNKDIRLSLKTKDIKIALKQRKILNLMSDEEFLNMHIIKAKDYYVKFEYDTEDEYEYKKQDAIDTIRLLKELDDEVSKKDLVNDGITFTDLEIKFINNKEKRGKVGKRSIDSYYTTFKKLKKFFGNRYIQDLSQSDFDDFENYLIGLKLNHKTINNYISYTKNFLDYALKYRFITYNPCAHLETLLEEDNKHKENFSNDEIMKILNANMTNEYKECFYVAAFTGMRISEILLLTNKDVKKDENNIKYFDIKDSKTHNGIRKIPIHPVLQEMNIDFPIFKNDYKTKNDDDSYIKNVNKRVLRQLYKVIPRDKTKKTFHTLRGTFVNRLINLFPEKILIIKELVGHSQDENALTINTYGKEFDLKLKNEIIQQLWER